MTTAENPLLSRVVAFLEQIGIETRRVRSASGFLRNTDIRAGVLLYTPRCPPSNLLHEAGHLAIIPGEFRRLIERDVEHSLARIAEHSQAWDSAQPDSPFCRAIVQCGDPEATAWAWAAGKHIGLPEAEIIRDSEYERTGPAMRAALRARQYVGINGLQFAGLCVAKEYPTLRRWLQPEGLSHESPYAHFVDLGHQQEVKREVGNVAPGLQPADLQAPESCLDFRGG